MIMFLLGCFTGFAIFMAYGLFIFFKTKGKNNVGDDKIQHG